MKEIKSVRLRKTNDNNGALDIKVILYEDNHTFGIDERVLVGMNNDYPIWLMCRYKKGGLFKDFTDNQFIDNFILQQSKSDPKASGYTIIQDPWEINVPKYRSYGFDSYYLNNGAWISISWLNGSETAGGKKYSDSNGNELTDSEKGYITKTATINSYNNEKVISLNKNGVFEYGFNSQEFSGLVNDIDIVKLIIAKWINVIPKYSELDLCTPDNQSCSVIPYKSPLKPIEPEATTPEKVATNETTKIKLKVILPPGVIKAKIDIPSLKVYIGDVKEVVNDGFVFTDEEAVFLSPEYTDSGFVGLSETTWAPITNGPDDDVDGDVGKGLGDNEFMSQSFVPSTNSQKSFIKKAINSTLSKGEGHGRCARYVANHANNYIRLLQGKDTILGVPNSAGGNAKQDGYHNNLQAMGYQKLDKGTIQKNTLIEQIGNYGWEVGDVIVYWCTDGPSNASHVKYGHTQIYTGGYQDGSNYRWSTDNTNNYKSSFVYRTKGGNLYRYIVFKAPKTNRINDVA